MKKIFVLSVILVAIAAAEVFVDTAPFDIEVGYTVELPDDYDSSRLYPLIVGLHGFGDKMSSYVGTAQSFCPEGAIGLYPETPYPLEMGEGKIGWSWFQWGSPEFHEATVEQSTRWILRAIDLVKQKYLVDPNKVFLYGFSQGGMMTYQVGIRYPELFRGLLPAGGWLEVKMDSLHSLDSVVLELPVRAFHGAYDDVVDFREGRAAVDTLASYGVPAELMSYPCKHQITVEMMEDARDFIYCQLYEGAVSALTELLWPDEELEPSEHVELLRQVLCSPEPVADIEAGLLELYGETESTEIRKQIIYLLGARRCAGSEFLLVQLLSDETQPQDIRQASYSALIKLATETAWQTAEKVAKQVVVTEVVPGSQADSSGVQRGDVIISYNRKSIKIYTDLKKAMETVKSDQKTVTMVVSRDDKKIQVKLAPGTIGVRLAEEIK